MRASSLLTRADVECLPRMAYTPLWSRYALRPSFSLSAISKPRWRRRVMAARVVWACQPRALLSSDVVAPASPSTARSSAPSLPFGGAVLLAVLVSASFEEEVPSPAFAGKLSGAVMDGAGAAVLSLGWRLQRFCDAGGLGSLLRAFPLSALACPPLNAALRGRALLCRLFSLSHEWSFPGYMAGTILKSGPAPRKDRRRCTAAL